MCVYLSAATGDFACSRTSNRLDRLSDFLRLAVVVVIIVVINVFHLNTKKAAPPVSQVSQFMPILILSLPFSLSLSMVVIYLIACKKPTHTHITITRKKIQIPSTAQARNQQESYRCVSVHTHNI